MGGRSCTTIRRPIRASLALAAVLAAGCGDAADHPVALLGATIIDGTGGPVLVDGGILIRDGRIEAIGSRETLILPRGTESIELAGRFIIPGLVDAHTTAADWALPRYVEFGITATKNEKDTVNDYFIADNTMTGRSVWPRTPETGIEDRRGVQLSGAGHVVCYNRISNFGDAIDTFQDR